MSISGAEISSVLALLCTSEHIHEHKQLCAEAEWLCKEVALVPCPRSSLLMAIQEEDVFAPFRCSRVPA